ncbi:uncharacterized protein LACBIDRAFT_302809 [Laccaria bicolor S238N-H82]|uniref:Predicted protein n=1 Tax=Laccaria bicolor (strain S238N-H82 / ATCC MYA-4686) TaxID=486041 RepID=B0DIC8_LACBS|nr:uncharacterized protein LACBIDRAFT_302809 [Laccaria bicolor S238N-H82]EDR05667.1 predicted protein [Laccaria bicolor S238N-H82]|eukprot:XP_001883771.1 predicted protein [Laccaria bicolor S238N-H82]
MKPSQKSYVPTHRDFVVEFVPGDYMSSLKTKRGFQGGDLLARLEGFTKGPKAYTSVQCGRGANDHIELNTDLVYVNHSCEPNVAFDLSSPDTSNWHLRALRRIEPGETLTFFYPSTEWEMDQPFDCQCGTPSCLGTIQGAKFLTTNELAARQWVSPWILELVAERDGCVIEKA